MREINPRAWSIDGECWCTRVDYDGYKKEWSGIVPVLAPDNRSKIIGEIEDTNIIVEFPIGLKDKNGKKICEGDIVQIDSMDELRIGYVELVADQYCIVCGEEDGHKIVAEFYYYSKPEENCKVIGNIHENPELLDVKKEG